MKNLQLFFIQMLIATELLAFVVGLLFLRNRKNRAIKTFVVYLGIISLSELFNYLFKAHITFSNLYYTYFIIPLEFLFFHWYYYQFSDNKQRKIILICAVVFVLSFIVEQLLIEKVGRFPFNSLSYTVGNAVLLVIVILYFLKLTNSNKILTFSKQHLFWVSFGLLLFYLGTFPFFGMINILYKNHKNLAINYGYVMLLLNSFMYLLFAASFIWGKEET